MSAAEGQFQIDADKSLADLISAKIKFWKLRMATQAFFSKFFWLLW